MAHSVTVYFARKQECLSASMYRIVPSISLVCATNVPSRMELEDPLELGLMIYNSIRSIKTNGRRSWNPSRRKPRYYIALSRNPVFTVKSIRSRISGAEASKKTGVSSSEDWGYYSSIDIYSSLDKHRRPAGCKEIHKLDHVVKNNLNNYNDQNN